MRAPVTGKFYKLLLKLGGMEDIPELSRRSQFNMAMWSENKERVKGEFIPSAFARLLVPR